MGSMLFVLNVLSLGTMSDQWAIWVVSKYVFILSTSTRTVDISNALLKVHWHLAMRGDGVLGESRTIRPLGTSQTFRRSTFVYDLVEGR